MDKQQVLHQAEELGQGRALTSEEIRALTLMAIIAGAWGACVGLLLFNAYWLWKGEDLSLASLGLPALAGLVVGSGAVLVVGGKEVIDGLRSWREAKTFGPSSPSTADPGPTPHPFLVRAGERSYIDYPDKPLALPAPERKKLELTPGVLSVILKEIVEGHGGLWSRARIMGIRIDGQRVPRRIYEEMTSLLAKTGVLGERAQGGYEFPHHIKTLADLEPYFPGLTGMAGGQAGRPERGGLQETHQVGGGAGPAERARDRWLQQGEGST